MPVNITKVTWRFGPVKTKLGIAGVDYLCQGTYLWPSRVCRQNVSSQNNWHEARRVRRKVYGFRHKFGFRRDSAGGYAVYIEKLRHRI